MNDAPVTKPAPVPIAAPAKPTAPGKPPVLDCTADFAALRNLPRPERGPQRGQTSWPSGRYRFDSGQVVGYIYGRCYFADVAAAIKTATSAEHRVYIAGWWVQTDTQLLRQRPDDPNKPLYLTDLVAASPAQIRSLTWKPLAAVAGAPNNQPWVAFVNGLPQGAAVADAKLPVQIDDTGIRVGVHHQKIVVVVGELGTNAFLGGMDLNNTRTHEGGVEPLHDVHLRLTGAPATMVLKTFQERWTDLPETAKLEVDKFKASPSTPYVRAFPSSAPLATNVPTCTLPQGAKLDDRRVSVGRTYADLRKFGGPAPYAFAPSGERTAEQMVVGAIRQARLIYLEEQYLTSKRIRLELAARLRDKEFLFLLILMCNSDEIDPTEFRYLRVYRNEFRLDLTTADPARARWGMYSLSDTSDPNRRPFAGSYVHSKTWIFDDTYVITGSANCTDRSFTFDTEIVAGVSEGGFVPRGPDAFATALRINLWHKHLGVPHNKIRTWTDGLKYWRNPPKTAMIYDNSQQENDPYLNAPFDPDDRDLTFWRNSYDTDGAK